jgi:hypothetical protein
LERLPLFVRAGAIIPLGPVLQYDGERPVEEVTALIYPTGTSSFTLYEDDGASRRYLDGANAETKITYAAEAGGLTCRIAAVSGDESLIPQGRNYTLQIRTDKPPRSVALESGAQLPQGRPSDPGTWWHDGSHFLIIRLATPAASVRIDW